MGSYSEALQLGGDAEPPLSDLLRDCDVRHARDLTVVNSSHPSSRWLRLAVVASLACGALAAAVLLVTPGAARPAFAPDAGPLVAPSVDEVLEQIEVFERLKERRERLQNATRRRDELAARARNTTDAWRSFYGQVDSGKTRPLNGAQKAQCGVQATIDAMWIGRAAAFVSGAIVDCASGPIYKGRCGADILGVVHSLAHFAAMLAGLIGGCDEFIEEVDRLNAGCANAVIFAIDHFLAMAKLGILAQKSCDAAERQRKGLPPPEEHVDSPGAGANHIGGRATVVHKQLRETFCVFDSIQPALMLANAGLAINNINPVCTSINDAPTLEEQNEKRALCVGVMLSATSLILRAAGLLGLAGSHCSWLANKDALCTAPLLLITGRAQAVGGAISRAYFFCTPTDLQTRLNISNEDPVAGVD